MEEIGGNILATAVILLALAWFTMVVAAFRTSFGWGLAVLAVLPAPLFALRRFSEAKGPAVLVCMALFTGALAPIAARYEVWVNGWGPYEDVVANERHLTLTGWGRQDYSIIARKRDVVVLQMANADVTDETLKYLGGLNRLRELDLNDSSITDAGLEIISKLPALQDLRLRRTKITDAGFRKSLMANENLTKLTLTGTAVPNKTAREWKKAKAGRNFN